jgi:hypothetical protein
MGRRNTSNGSYQQKQSRHQQKEERKQTESVEKRREPKLPQEHTKTEDSRRRRKKKRKELWYGMGGEINERTLLLLLGQFVTGGESGSKCAAGSTPIDLYLFPSFRWESSSKPELNLIDRGGRRGSRDVNRDALKARTRKERNRASPRWRWPVCAPPPPYSPGTPLFPDPNSSALSYTSTASMRLILQFGGEENHGELEHRCTV